MTFSTTTQLPAVSTSLNFSGGPGALPEQVLLEASEAIRCAPGTNQSILGISHRSDWFKAMLQESEEHFRALLNIPKNYHVLQLQGGSSLQFSMIPLLLLRGKNKTAEYLRTGYWSAKSIPDAQREGKVKLLFDGEQGEYTVLPSQSELVHDPEAAYFHYVSNETVEGLQFHYLPGLKNVTRVCDMSSDFLCRPIDVNDYDLIYAHAQKNLGPSGLTLVIIKDELLQNAPDDLHSMLDYRNHVKMESIYNTPPVFAIYVTMLVARWLRNTIGGVEKMAAINARKAAALYGLLDEHPNFFMARAAKKDRSIMNVAFRLKDEKMDELFLKEATAAGFYGLEGHRSVGGLRASLYNAVTEEDVARLLEMMSGFRARHEK
jgi:phosphoserine aminotransferase